MSPKSNRGSVQLAHQALTIEAEAQQVLDELLNGKLIRFALNVGKITKGSREYTIHFYDSSVAKLMPWVLELARRRMVEWAIRVVFASQ